MMISSFFDDVNSLDCYTEYLSILDDDLIILIPWATVTSLHHFHHWVEPLVYNYSSLIKVSLHYLSQTSQNNLSKTSIWKTVISKNKKV